MADGRLPRDMRKAIKLGLLGGIASTMAPSTAATPAAFQADFNTLLSKLTETGMLGGNPTVVIPDPEPEPEPNPSAKMIGMNLSPVVYYGGVRPFTNLANYHLPQVRDAGGGLTASQSLPYNYFDQATNVVTIPANRGFTALAIPKDRTKRIRLRYAGTSVPSVLFNSATDITSGNDGTYNYIEFLFAGNTNVSLDLSPGTISFFDAREVDRPLNQRFDPDYLLECSRYSHVRFMDWQFTNRTSNINITENYRPKSTSIFRQLDWGESYETCIDFCAAAGVNGWINLPYKCDETYVRGFVAYAKQVLGPLGLYLYVESVNEYWNYQFDVNAYARDDWRAQFPSTGEYSDVYAGQAYTSNKQMTWLETKANEIGASYGKTGLLRRVIAGQTGGGSNLDFLLDRPGVTAHHDYFANAPYYGQSVWRPGITTAEEASILESHTLMTTNTNDGIDNQVEMMLSVQAQIAPKGLALLQYEGANSHMVTGEIPISSAIHKHPGMRKVESYALRELRRRLPTVPITIFADQGAISIYGPFGIKDDAEDINAPRYLAVRDALNEVYTVPALTIVNEPPPLTVGNLFTFEIDARWGSGPGTAKTFGALNLPAGLTRNGNLITGTPTQAGTTQVTLSCTDSTGTTTKIVPFVVTAAEIYAFYDDASTVGNLPRTGASSSRTNARGWAVDWGYANNGFVLRDTLYVNQGSFAAPNVKNRKLLYDTTTLGRDYEDAALSNEGFTLDIIRNETGVNSRVYFTFRAKDGFMQILSQNAAGDYAYFRNVNAPQFGGGMDLLFEVELANGFLQLFINGNDIIDRNELPNGYPVGSDYLASQKSGVELNSSVDLSVTPVKAYRRIGVRAL